MPTISNSFQALYVSLPDFLLVPDVSHGPARSIDFLESGLIAKEQTSFPEVLSPGNPDGSTQSLAESSLAPSLYAQTDFDGDQNYADEISKETLQPKQGREKEDRRKSKPKGEAEKKPETKKEAKGKTKAKKPKRHKKSEKSKTPWNCETINIVIRPENEAHKDLFEYLEKHAYGAKCQYNCCLFAIRQAHFMQYNLENDKPLHSNQQEVLEQLNILAEEEKEKKKKKGKKETGKSEKEETAAQDSDQVQPKEAVPSDQDQPSPSAQQQSGSKKTEKNQSAETSKTQQAADSGTTKKTKKSGKGKSRKVKLPFNIISQYGINYWEHRFLQDNEDVKDLHSHCRQAIAKKAVDDYMSCERSMEEWRKDKSKIKSMPNLPDYKKGNKGIIAFSNQSVTYSDGVLSFPSGLKIPLTNLPENFNGIACVDAVPYYDTWKICVRYYAKVSRRKVLSTPPKPEDPTFKPAAADLGVNNLFAVTCQDAAMLYCGRSLKSEVQYYSKKIAGLQSCYDPYREKVNAINEAWNKSNPDQKQKPMLPYQSKAIERAWRRRHHVIDDYLQKASAGLIDFCVEHEVTHLVLGKNNGWKQEVKLSSSVNQMFQFVPIAEFIKMVERKGKKAGITVVVMEESYTSKASFLDEDPIPVYGEEKGTPVFSGKRIKRGLYRSKENIVINADLNGSGNIGRKYFGTFTINEDVWTNVEVVIPKTRIAKKKHRDKDLKYVKSPFPKRTDICETAELQVSPNGVGGAVMLHSR